MRPACGPACGPARSASRRRAVNNARSERPRKINGRGRSNTRISISVTVFALGTFLSSKMAATLSTRRFLRNQHDLAEMQTMLQDVMRLANLRQREYGMNYRIDRSGEDRVHHRPQIADVAHRGANNAAMPFVDFADFEVGPL